MTTHIDTPRAAYIVALYVALALSVVVELAKGFAV